MKPRPTRKLQPDETGIRQAVKIWRSGGLVAFPTETVYGLGADATNDQAVVRIFAAKGRPAFNPLIVHVADIETARRFADFGAKAEILAQAFWPGPLSLVLPARADGGIAASVTAGHDTVAIRVPQTAFTRELLRRFDGAIAAPSANPSGRISPTSAAHVIAGLDGKIDAILDAGTCRVGLESTIVGFDPVPTLLRPGGLPVEAIEDCLGTPLARHGGTEINAPGQLASHYAPRAPLRLNAEAAEGDEVLLGFGAVKATLNLSAVGDLTEAAANLFTHLHALDALARPIAVSPIPEHGIGRAIIDRLRRAAS